MAFCRVLFVLYMPCSMLGLKVKPLTCPNKPWPLWFLSKLANLSLKRGGLLIVAVFELPCLTSYIGYNILIKVSSFTIFPQPCFGPLEGTSHDKSTIRRVP